MTHAELKELLALHALGALDPDAAAELDGHLEQCASCAAERAELEATAAELARAAEAVAPSPELSRRILEAVRSEPRLTVLPRARRRAEAGRGASLPPATARRPWRILSVAARIAVAALLLIVVVSYLDLARRHERALDLLARGRALLEVIASPSVVTIPLGATTAASPARAILAFDRRSGQVSLLAFDLPPPPAQHVYQLWRVGDDFQPGVVFSPDARGGTMLHDQWSPAERDAPLFAVTVEPAPGAREPTGEMVLLGASPQWRPPTARLAAATHRN